jgi:RNA polymerase sigma factor (sigma-70 family)
MRAALISREPHLLGARSHKRQNVNCQHTAVRHRDQERCDSLCTAPKAAHRSVCGVAVGRTGNVRRMNESTKHPRGGLKDQLALLRRRLLQRGRSSRRDIDELIQEGFLRLCLYQRSQKVPVRDPVGFLVEAVEKVHIDRARRAVLTQRIFSDQSVEEVDCVDTNSPEQDAELQELIERIEWSLAAANPRTREAFLLHRFDGRSSAEIAEQLGISSRAVRDHIAKALLLIDNALSRDE